MAAQAASRRLRKEHLLLERDPENGLWASPNEKNILHWEFVLMGSEDTPYEGGVYHGRLNFPNSFPMAPPAITMVTPSGRFECDKKICMSMSDFHPELWNPTWSVRTILVGFLSFMNSEEQTTGGITNAATGERVRLAKASLGATLSNPTYGAAIAQLFPAVTALAEARKRHGSASSAGAEQQEPSPPSSSSWPPPRLAAAPLTQTQVEARQEAKRVSAEAEAKRATAAAVAAGGDGGGEGSRSGTGAQAAGKANGGGDGGSDGDGDENDPLVGATVELHSLMARPELNGRRGTVASFVPSSGRYAVRLSANDQGGEGGVGGGGGGFFSGFFGSGGSSGGGRSTEIPGGEGVGESLEEVSLKMSNLNLIEMPPQSTTTATKATPLSECGSGGTAGAVDIKAPLSKGQKKKEQQRRKAEREKAEAEGAAAAPN